MNNSFPKRNLPLRVVLHRLGEPTLAQYKATHTVMNSPEVAFELWQEVIAVDPNHEPDKEHLITVFLNTKLRVIGYHVVSVGSLNEAVAHPREIFRAAIIAGAYALVLMHNHPSGDPTPSAADLRMTRKVQQGAEIIGISLLDHVVIGTAKSEFAPFHSFQKSGLL